MDDAQTLEFAIDATERLKNGSHLLDWFAVGAGLAVGARQALTETGANDKTSKLYQNAFGAWMTEHEWARGFDKTTRNHAIWLHENKEDINKFLETMAGNKRIKLNHPTSVRRAWDKVHVIPEPKEPREKKANITEEEHEALIAYLDEANEKIVSLESVIADKEWTKPVEDHELKPSMEVPALREKLSTAEQEIARLRARVAELEATQPKPEQKADEKLTSGEMEALKAELAAAKAEIWVLKTLGWANHDAGGGKYFSQALSYAGDYFIHWHTLQKPKTGREKVAIPIEEVPDGFLVNFSPWGKNNRRKKTIEFGTFATYDEAIAACQAHERTIVAKDLDEPEAVNDPIVEQSLSRPRASLTAKFSKLME